ncbi:MAG: immunoglobulin domain-containing protein [Verrucomicrobiales bacterium]|nr:immunoglobulin domain-containing protein [Verrucomicrobiales bacterium]
MIQLVKLLWLAVTGFSVFCVAAFSRPGSLNTDFDSTSGADATLRPGTVDLSFQCNALASTPGPAYVTHAKELADGKLVVAGFTSNLMSNAIARLNADGSVDTSFPTVLVGGRIRDIHLQGDGKMVLVVKFIRPRIADTWGVIRLNVDGTLDSSFQPLPNHNPYTDPIGFQTILPLSNGQLLVAGSGSNFNLFWSPAPVGRGIVRLEANGQIAPSFDVGYGATSNYDHGIPVINAVAVDGLGRIIVGGLFESFGLYSGSQSGPLARLNPDGSLDQSFHPQVEGMVHRVIVLPDGKLLIGGNLKSTSVPGQNDIWVRLLPDGTEDSAFSKVTVPPQAPINLFGLGANLFSLQADGKLLAGIDYNIPASPYGRETEYLTRFNTDGTPDTGFAANVTDIASVSVLRDQKIIVGGVFDSFDGHPCRGIVRLNGGDLPEGPPYVLLSPAGQTAHAGTRLTISAQAIGVPPPAYQWFHDGQPVPGQTNSALNFPNVLPRDAGRYHVVASNSFGSVASSEAALDVSPIENIPGAVDPEFFPGEGPDGAINAMVAQPDGKIVIGGDFLKYDGVPRVQLARIFPDGGLDPTFVPRRGLGGPVNFLGLEADGTLLGGVLRDTMGQSHLELRWLRPDGSEDTSRPPRQINGTMLALQPDGKWIVYSYPSGIIRLNANGDRDTTFAPTFRGISEGWPAYTISVAGVQLDGKIIVPGSSGVGGPPLLRLNPDGSVDASFQYEEPREYFYPLEGLAIQHDGKILLGSKGRLARLNCDGSADATFTDPHVDASRGPSIAVDLADRIFVAGGFRQVGTIFRNGLARLRPWEPSAAPPVITAPPANQSLKAGQTLVLSANSTSDACMNFQWLRNGEPLKGFTNPTLSISRVFPEMAGGYSVIVGNDWGSVTSRVAQVEIEAPETSPGALDLTFWPALDLDGRILAFEQDSAGNLIVSGYENVPGSGTGMWQRFRPGGEQDSDFARKVRVEAPGTSPGLLVIAIQSDGRMLFGGTFSKLNSRDQGGILRLNVDGSLDETFSPGSGPFLHNEFNCCGVVYAILPMDNGQILVGGLFDTFSGQPHAALVRLNADGSLDPGFSADAKVPDVAASDAPKVQCLTLAGSGRVLVGGYFQSIGGQPRFHLARLLPDGTVDPKFVPGLTGPDGRVEKVIAQPDGRLLVGGSLRFPGENRKRAVARLHPDGSLDPSFLSVLDLSPQSLFPTELAPPFFDFRLLAVDATGMVYGSGTLRDNLPGSYFSGLVRLFPDGQQDLNFKVRLSPLYSRIIGALPQPNGDLVIAGDFASVNEAPRELLARTHGGPMDTLRLFNLGFEQGLPSFSAQIPVGIRYSLEFTGSLPSPIWQPLTNGIGDGILKMFRDPAPSSPHRFYRLRRE